MSPLCITLVQGAFLPVPPVRGGAVEKLWLALGREFASRGHRVTQISRAFPGQAAREVVAGVAHRRVSGFDAPRGLVRLKLLDLLYTVRVCRVLPPADILVSNTFWLPVLARGRKFGRLYVSVERMPRGQMRFYRNAPRLRAPSQAVAEAIIAEDSGAAGRVAVIPNPLPFIPAHGPQVRPRRREVVYAGRLHPEKGIALLLEAWERGRLLGLGDWRLLLVGSAERAVGGGGSRWLQELKARYRDPSIAWVGPIHDSVRLNEIHEGARLFVYPSLAERGETFGLAPLEAMAWGSVPVVSDLACFRDFIRDGENGFVFNHRAADPAAALAQRLLDAACAVEDSPRYETAALRVRETHAVGSIAESFLADFQTLLRPA